MIDVLWPTLISTSWIAVANITRRETWHAAWMDKFPNRTKIDLVRMNDREVHLCTVQDFESKPSESEDSNHLLELHKTPVKPSICYELNLVP